MSEPPAPVPNTVTLVPLTSAEFEAWLPSAIRDYAGDKVAAGNWTEAEALERSTAAFNDLLPQGIATPGQYLYSIVAVPEPGAGPQPVGMIWFATLEGQSQAFIYDFIIHVAFRRRGYAEQALRALETEVRAIGLDSIGLHVFGHNHGARSLYEKLGYEITNINMAKRLPPAP